MPSIAEIKSQYPDLSDATDDQVVDALHQAFYSDLPREQIAAKLGVKLAPPPPDPNGPSRMGDLARSLKTGVEQLPGQLTGLADIPFALAFNARPFSEATDAIGDATGFKPGQWAKDTRFSPEHDESARSVGEAWKGSDAVLADPNASTLDYAKAVIQSTPALLAAYASNPLYTLNQVVNSLPGIAAGGVGSKLLMGAGRLAGVAGDAAAGVAARAPVVGYLERAVGEKAAAPIAAGVGEGGQQAGSQMDQYTGTDQRKNAIAALGSGTTDAVLSALGGRIANHLGLETAGTALAKAGSGERATSALSAGKRLAAGAAMESPVETVQSVTEQNFQNWADDKPLMEGALRQGVEGGLSGGVMGMGANVANGHAHTEEEVAPPPATPAPAAGDAGAPTAPTALTPADIAAQRIERQRAAVAAMQPAVGVPPAVVAAATGEPVAPLKTAGDVIRQDLQLGTGPLTRALNVGVEAAAQNADAALPSPELDTPHPPRPLSADQLAAIRTLDPEQQEQAVKYGEMGNDANVQPSVRRFAQAKLDAMLGAGEALNPIVDDPKTGEPILPEAPTVAAPKPGNENDQILARAESGLRRNDAAAAAQREADRPPIPTGDPQDGDILNRAGKPFTTMPGAQRALVEAGAGHGLVRVAGGLVVRKAPTIDQQTGEITQTKDADGPASPADALRDPGGAPAVAAAPGGTGNVDGAERSSAPADGSVADVGASPVAVDRAVRGADGQPAVAPQAATAAQPTTLGAVAESRPAGARSTTAADVAPTPQRAIPNEQNTPAGTGTSTQTVAEKTAPEKSASTANVDAQSAGLSAAGGADVQADGLTPEARWNAAGKDERYKVLADAGWLGGPAHARLSETAWSDIKPFQQKRIAAKMAAAPEVGAPASPAPEAAPKFPNARTRAVAKKTGNAAPEGRRSQVAESAPIQPSAEAAKSADAASLRVAKALRAAGEKAVAEAEESMGRDRETNTHRRVSMAASAEAQAAQRAYIGKKMLRLADALNAGEAGALSKVTTKAQVEQLDQIAKQAMYAAERAAGLSYADQQRRKGRPFEEADLKHVELPVVKWQEGARESLLRTIHGKRGFGALSEQIRRAAGPTREIIDAATKLTTAADVERAIGWSAPETLARIERLRRAGITNTVELRAAVKDFVALTAERIKADPIKELERGLVGRKGIGVDFFPTPKATAERMVDEADIKPGMRVLEPSAGNGNIADAIRAAGVEPDTVETSSALREILEAKKYPIVGSDFLDVKQGGYDRIVMNPPFSERRDVAHVLHAYSLLKPGGKLVAIVGEGPFFGRDKKAADFRNWMQRVGATEERLPEGTFQDPSLPANTGVSSRMIVVEKAADDGELAFSRGGFESLHSNRPFDRFLQLGEAPGNGRQGMTDAKSLLNLPLRLNVRADPSLDVHTPARFELGTRVVAFNPRFPYSRAMWAQAMSEEVLHAVDALGHDSAISAASKRLALGTGDIATEAQAVHASGKGLADFLDYPLNPLFRFSPTRQQAELFARLGVLYHGDSALMQRALPIAFEAYHALFRTTHLGSGERVLANVLADPGSREQRGDAQSGPDAAADDGSGRGRQGRGADQGLDGLRSRIARIFDADPAGGVVDFSSAEGRAAGGSPGEDPAKHGAPAVVRNRIAAAEDEAQRRVDAGGIEQGEVAGEAPRKLTVAEEDQALAERIAAGWENKPDIKVVTSIDDPQVPQAVRDEDDKQRSLGAGGVPEGVFHDGTVYLFSDQLRGEADIRRVLLHEALGHYGLRGVFGKELGGILDRIAVARPAELKAKAEKYGLDLAKPKERRAAAEEMLAELAQTHPELGWVRQAVAAVRTWIRRHIPGAYAMKMSDAEVIRNYILPARNWVTKGGQTTISRTAFADTQPAVRAIEQGTPMFSRSLGAQLGQALNSTRDINLPAGYKVADLMDSNGKLSVWHKTVGTQYNLAQRSPEFKRVFDGVQSFINDTSFYANEAANLAPKILPKLENWKDIAKSPISAADTKALAGPLFDGTLSYARDASGKAVYVDAMKAMANGLAAEQKAHELFRNGHLSEQVLKMWQGLPVDQFNSIISAKYERDMLKAGVVWTDAELRDQFSMTPAQIGLYREFRAATDKSLSSLAVSEMLNLAGADADAVRRQALDLGDHDKAAVLLRDHLFALGEADPSRQAALDETANKMIEIADRATDLQNRGYAPLSRFGTYTLEATLPTGEHYFSLFETTRERAKMARQLAASGATGVKSGTMSQLDYKLLQGVSPETVALFGDMLGLESQGSEAKDIAFQTYIKKAVANRSALKRLLARKGTAGFSEDAGRVLAGFVYSNGRRTSSNLHSAGISDATAAMSKEGGELKDAAVKLADYVKNPQEEAQGLRGLLFAQYLGGSVASAMVNATQPFTVTFPYLSQFGGVTKAAKQMAAAVKVAGKTTTGDAVMDKALEKAEADGIVSPQEVHQLQAQAAGRAALKSGDGTTVGNAAATAQNHFARFQLAWGKVFSVAEQFNRRVTFIAAYRTALDQGIADPAAFAAKAVTETQFLFNKGNKPQWARGAIGGVAFTFKQYSVSYLELVHRMWNAGEEGSPERTAGRKAVLLAAAVLFLIGGADGLPFEGDVEDVLDGFMQRLGYNFSSRRAKNEFLARVLGDGMSQFVNKGLSGLPGAPIDVSGRMGMGNLIPGTGLLTKKPDHTSDVAELFGPVGDLGKRAFQAAGQVVDGNPAEAMATMSPVATRNVRKAADMLQTGSYRDQAGRKVIDTTPAEAILKGIGFQPNSVARVQEATGEVQAQVALTRLRQTELTGDMAQAVYEKDQAKIEDVRAAVRQWNADNPEAAVRVNMAMVLQKVRTMREDKATRIEKASPKGMRAAVRQQLAEAAQ